MNELRALRSLARAMGVHTRYTDGLGKHVTVAPETLVRVCAALGAPVTRPGDAAAALRAHNAHREGGLVPPVLVAWDGHLPALTIPANGPVHAELHLEGSHGPPLEVAGGGQTTHPVPPGYHRLTVEASGRRESSTVIAAPVAAWRRPESIRGWGVGAHLAALRSARSRAVGDLRDLESVCRWVRDRGGDLVNVLPLYPTFNSGPPEPSPYS